MSYNFEETKFYIVYKFKKETPQYKRHFSRKKPNNHALLGFF
jgi:hypothetical protein